MKFQDRKLVMAKEDISTIGTPSATTRFTLP